MSGCPKFRSIKPMTMYEIIVAEGEGTNESPIREVHYYIDEKFDTKFIVDPLEK